MMRPGRLAIARAPDEPSMSITLVVATSSSIDRSVRFSIIVGGRELDLDGHVCVVL